jgi:hypothetical protein
VLPRAKAWAKGTAGPNDYDTVVTEKVVTKPAESTHDAK